MRKIAIITFGCQMNKLDSELAAEALADAGHAVVDDEAAADTVIFNTCSVRDHAERRVLSRLGRLKGRREADPRFRIGVMGCFAEREGEKLLRRLPYLDFAVGTRKFMRLPEVLASIDAGAPGGNGLFGGGEEREPGLDQAHPRSRHRGIRGFVSVMRGCDNRCSYCIVPEVRGGESSRRAEDVVAEVSALAREGAREVTLLGQNIDAYGRHDGSSLAELIRLIDRGVPAGSGLLRIRFVTSHPRDITRELATAVAETPRVCRHFHMPAQSGSDSVLAAMRRGYDRATYDDKLAMIREILPDATVASDFIVGFPGETEADYLATRDLVEKAGFQNSYVFKYSPRPGTASAREKADDVPDAEKRRRNNDLLAVQNRVGQARGEGLIGSRQTAMAEGPSPRDPSRWTGRTGGNLICVFPAPGPEEDLSGREVELIIEAATPLTLFGRRAGEERLP